MDTNLAGHPPGAMQLIGPMLLRRVKRRASSRRQTPPYTCATSNFG